jgi:hypothetical protein
MRVAPCAVPMRVAPCAVPMRGAPWAPRGLATAHPGKWLAGPFPDTRDCGAGSQAVKGRTAALPLAYGSVTARPTGAIPLGVREGTALGYATARRA